MNTNDNPSSETLADEVHVASADGGETVANTDTLSLTDLNKIFGTTFKDPDAALKAIKETKSFVGKKLETPAAEPAQSAPEPSEVSELKSTVQRLERDSFFNAHPEYQEHRALIESLGNPAEVVVRDDVKALLEKAKVADEVSQTKSVVSSSSRIGQEKQATDTAVQIANGGGTTEDVANVLAKAVLESLES
jgi:hypothetical protein